MAVWYCFSKSNLLSIHALVCHQKSYLGISGNRMPSSSTKTPPAAKTWRWWSEYRAKRAVVGVSLSPLWSPFLRGLNSSSRNTSQTTKFLKLSVLHKCDFLKQQHQNGQLTLRIGRRRKRIFPFWFRWVCLVCKFCRSSRHAKSSFWQCDVATFLLDHLKG